MKIKYKNWKPYYEDIKTMYGSNMLTSDIAKKYHTSVSTICQILKKNTIMRSASENYKLMWKLNRCRPEKLKSEREIIKELYTNGESTHSIAKKYKVSSQFIYNIISKHNIRTLKDARDLAIKKRNWGCAKHRNKYKEFQDLYIFGYSTVDIAKMYNLNQGTVSKILSKTIGLRSAIEAAKLRKDQCKFRGKNCYRWIKDRSKLSRRQRRAEEEWFIKEVLAERNYTCELTQIRGGSLEVHHIVSVHTDKSKQFDKSNVIVVQKIIHRTFHKLYGTKKSTEADWNKFVESKEYLKYPNGVIKNKFLITRYKINLAGGPNAIQIGIAEKMDVCQQASHGQEMGGAYAEERRAA